MNRRDNITVVAMDLFLQRGVKNVNMDMISQKTGISKKTFYYHFKNKAALVRSSGELIRDEQGKIINKILLESENTTEAVFKLLIMGSNLFSRINPIYFSDVQRFYPKIWNEAYRKCKTYTHSIILKLIQRGILEGIYKKCINEDLTSFMITEQLCMITDRNYFEKFSLTDIYENVIINSVTGISTENGLILLNKSQHLPNHRSVNKPDPALPS